MTHKKYLPLYLLLAMGVLLMLVAFLGNILLPFALGFAAAYFLDPIADRLESLGLPRIIATAIITLAFLAGLTFAAIYGVPLLIDQLTQLAAVLPLYAERLQIWVGVHGDFLPNMQSLVSNAEGIGARVLRSGGAVLNVISLLLITPIVAVYMLLDWDKMVATIDAHLPPSIAPQVRALASDMDKRLAGFARGQMAVCALMAIFYAAALYALGLQGAIAVGVLSGALTFIPYIGMSVGLALATFLALGQFGFAWASVLPIFAIFAVGQFAEGNFLTPRLIGDRVRLHPVWILFALLAMGTLLGFLGLLLAVPIAAIIGVLARFALREFAPDTK